MPPAQQLRTLPASLRRLDKDLAEGQVFRTCRPNLKVLNAEFRLDGAGEDPEKPSPFGKPLLSVVAEFEKLSGR